MVAQNDTIRTNYIKGKVDYTKQIYKCKLCDDKDDTVNPIISKYSKLAQKDYKRKHDWVEKMIYWGKT